MNKYLYFLSLQKTELNTMLHCIQIFTNTCEVTMQLKCYIGKALLHYRQTTNILPIHVLVLIKSPHYFAQLPVYVVCFPNVIKTLLHGFDPHIMFYPCCKFSRVLTWCRYLSQCNNIAFMQIFLL